VSRFPEKEALEMKTLVSFLCGFLLAVTALTPTSAKTWYVPVPIPSISAAMDSAVTGDCIEVAHGSYLYESGITLKCGVCLYSEHNTAECVTIDAQNLNRVLYSQGCAATSHVRGFTFLNGRVTGNDGGGLYCSSSSVHFQSCVFENNSAMGSGEGGGIYCDSGSDVTLYECDFNNNSAPDRYGGGIYCYNSELTLSYCRFYQNTARWGGGIYSYASVSSSSMVLRSCEFSENEAMDAGGGISFHEGSAFLTGCDFLNNTSLGTTSGNSHNAGGAVKCNDGQLIINGGRISGNHSEGRGGAIYVWGYGGPPNEIRNCTITGNTARGRGGGLYYDAYSAISLRSCTISGNLSEEEGGGLYKSGDGPGMDISNAILWDNCADLGGHELYLWEGDTPSSLTCCAVDTTAGWKDGNGPIVMDRIVLADPLCCDPAPQGCAAAPTVEGDYTISPDSQCHPDHSPALCGLIGALPNGCAATPAPEPNIESATWATIKAKYRK
jgi:parallel beta-helix repeat protein/predicted outer membrane repeat protein